MSTFPLAFKIVRNGGMEEVRVDDRPELVRLRTELELIRRCGLGADRPVVEALQEIVTDTGGDDARELLTILLDAMNPLVQAAIARIDRESPGVRREMPEQVIASEAGKFRGDLANCLRRSARPDAAALAEAYQRRSQLNIQDLPMPAETGVAAAPAVDSTSRPTPDEGSNTMSTNASDSQKNELDALGRDIDEAIDSSARAAADGNVEAVLKAAVEAADRQEVNDTNDEVDQFLDDALAELDAVEKASQSSSAAAPPEPAPAAADEETVDVDAFIAAVEEADQLAVIDTNEEVAGLVSQALEQAEQASAPVATAPKEAGPNPDAGTVATEPADSGMVRDANEETPRVPSGTPEETNTPPVPANVDGQEPPVNIEAFAAAIEEADKQVVRDLNEDIDQFLTQALEEVDAVVPAGSDVPAVSGPEQLEQIARGEPRPPPDQRTGVAQTVETAIAEVASHLDQVASQVDAGASDAGAATIPTTGVDLEASPSADDALVGVEVGLTSLVNAVGQSSTPEKAAPQPSANTSESPPPEVPAAAGAPATPVATQPTVEPSRPAEAIPTPPVAEAPATAPEPAPAAPAAPEAAAPNVCPASVPATAVDDIERGVGQLARFLSGEVLHLWTQAKQAMQEAQAFRNESQRIHAETGRMLAEVQAMQREVATAREQAQSDRQEAQNLRDDIRKTLERVRRCADDAANAADAAQTEARNAAAFAQLARPPK